MEGNCLLRQCKSRNPDGWYWSRQYRSQRKSSDRIRANLGLVRMYVLRARGCVFYIRSYTTVKASTNSVMTIELCNLLELLSFAIKVLYVFVRQMILTWILIN